MYAGLTFSSILFRNIVECIDEFEVVGRIVMVMPRYAVSLRHVITHADAYGIEARHMKEVSYQIICAVDGEYLCGCVLYAF